MRMSDIEGRFGLSRGDTGQCVSVLTSLSCVKPRSEIQAISSRG